MKNKYFTEQQVDAFVKKRVAKLCPEYSYPSRDFYPYALGMLKEVIRAALSDGKSMRELRSDIRRAGKGGAA